MSWDSISSSLRCNERAALGLHVRGSAWCCLIRLLMLPVLLTLLYILVLLLLLIWEITKCFMVLCILGSSDSHVMPVGEWFGLLVLIPGTSDRLRCKIALPSGGLARWVCSVGLPSWRLSRRRLWLDCARCL